MYYEHWNLRESPFGGHFDPRYFYQSANAEEVLARLHYLVDQHRRLGLLLGNSGVGKSQMLQVFAGQSARAGMQVASVQALGIESRELLLQLTAQLGLCPAQSATSPALWRMLDDHLQANRYEQIGTLVLIDDADEADAGVLGQIARVVQSDPTPEGRLTVLLSAQPERAGHLGRRLLELAELRIDLEPWPADDTAAYLRTAIALAGGQREAFHPAALIRIHQLTEGVPRRVKQLAELALLAAASQHLPIVDPETVEDVFYELGLTLPVGLQIEQASTS